MDEHQRGQQYGISKEQDFMFVIQYRDRDYLYVDPGGKFRWVEFDRATIFTGLGELVSAIVQAVATRPDNWFTSYSNHDWVAHVVEPRPPTPPRYRIVGRVL